MNNESFTGEDQHGDEVPPERWSVEMPHDFSDWMDRSVRYENDPYEYGMPSNPTAPVTKLG